MDLGNPHSPAFDRNHCQKDKALGSCHLSPPREHLFGFMFKYVLKGPSSQGVGIMFKLPHLANVYI